MDVSGNYAPHPRSDSISVPAHSLLLRPDLARPPQVRADHSTDLSRFSRGERCYLENDDVMLGENLLVAAVVEPGQRARSVYLPAGSGWYDFWSGDYYPGGQEVLLPAPWDRPPLLAKEGCAIPLNVADQHFAKPADERGFAVFPKRNEGSFEC